MGRLMGSLQILFLNPSNLLVIRNSLKTQSLKSNYQRGTGKKKEKKYKKVNERKTFRAMAKTSSFQKSTSIFHQPIFFFYFLWKEQHVFMAVGVSCPLISLQIHQYASQQQWFSESMWKNTMERLLKIDVINTEQNIQSLI